MNADIPSGVADLLARSNRLGSDPTVTNYGGGNTSVKVRQVSPATGAEVELLYVKGSGGDLGTLKAGGLAVLELDRVRALDGVYRGVEFEDEMVGFFPFCAFGTGGATPSIDTPMHGLVHYDHVDHLHPDAVIALACAADGEALVEKIWGGTVAWVPWKRPGWELGARHGCAGRGPESHRRRARRPWADRLGDHQRRGRAAESADHRAGAGLPRREFGRRTVRAGGVRPEDAGSRRQTGQGRGTVPASACDRLRRSATGRALQRFRGRAGLHVPREARPPRVPRNLVS